jgi:hypothetical protein
MKPVIILPACNEAACLPAVLAELLPVAQGLGCVIAVGLNDCSDDSAAVMQRYPQVVTGETEMRGYGHGCLAALSAVAAAGMVPDCYLFMAADGANDPALMADLLAHHTRGADLVLGQRTLCIANFRRLGLVRVASNLLLAAWASLLSGRVYSDLGPYRLISARLMRSWALLGRDPHWGWTIEPQVIAPMLGMQVRSLCAAERPRIAGEQKVTGVSWRQSARIGALIAQKGLCMWRRVRKEIISASVRTVI